MTVYEKLRRRPAVFRNLTGLSIEEFEALYQQLVNDIERYDETRLEQGERQRAVGAGRRYDHDARNRLLMAMIWLRVYPTYEVLGFIFDLDKSNICRNLKGVLAVLREQLGDEVEWPDQSAPQTENGPVHARISRSGRDCRCHRTTDPAPARP